MVRTDALNEFKKMWTWLYRHPAHGKKYYVKHVAKIDPAWKNDCPLCEMSDGECKECLTLWNQGHGSLCTDPNSPQSKWQKTELGNPYFRSYYAGNIAHIANKALKKVG